MKHLFLFTLLVLATPALAQYTISGYVTDSLTKQPLREASVRLDAGTKGVLTDANGYFTITATAGSHVLLVRYIGYRIHREAFAAFENRDFRVALNPIANELDEVSVTAKGADANVRRPLLGVNSLSIKTIRTMPAALGEPDILRSLLILPGVTSVGEASNGVNIRGGTTDQNLLLLDEAPLFNPTHMFGLFSAFPTDAVSGVNVYKGNVPSRFGGRTAGVIDVPMANPNLETVKLSGGLSIVANRLNADVPIIKNKLGILITGRGAFNDWGLPLISDKLRDIQARFTDLSARLFWVVNPKNTLSWSAYHGTDAFRTNLVTNLADVVSEKTSNRQNTLNSTLRWTHLFTDRLNGQTALIYARYRPSLVFTEKAVNDQPANEVVLGQEVEHRQAKFSLNYLLATHKLDAGLSVVNIRLQPGTLDPGRSAGVNALRLPNEQSVELAPFVEDEWQPTDKLSVSAGLRYVLFRNLGPATLAQYAEGQLPERDESTGQRTYAAGETIAQYGGLEPRLGLRYSLNPSLSVKAGYNQMQQFTQIIENTTTPLPTARWKTADTYLQPQRSQLATLGLFKNFAGDIYELSLEGYYRRTQNVIDYKPGAQFLLEPAPETELLQGINKAYGVELFAAKKKGELTGWISYTYSRTFNQINQGPGVRQQVSRGDWYAANYDRPHILNANLTLNFDKWNTFAFTFNYSDGRPFTAPTGVVRVDFRPYFQYEERNNARMTPYHRLDFSWHIHNPSTRERRFVSDWSFTVYNLYGRNNVYSVFFRTENEQLKPYSLSIFAAPIITINYNFKFQ